MDTSERVGFLFGFNFYGWGWWAAVAILLIGFGGVNIFRWFSERETFWRPTTMSFLVGDSLGLPLLGGAEAKMLVRFGGSSKFYTTTWFQIIILVVGVMVAGFFMKMALDAAVKAGKPRSLKSLPLAEVYHSMIFGLLFYLLVGPAIAVLSVVHWDQLLLIAAVGLSLWAIGVAIDMLRGALTPDLTAA